MQAVSASCQARLHQAGQPSNSMSLLLDPSARGGLSCAGGSSLARRAELPRMWCVAAPQGGSRQQMSIWASRWIITRSFPPLSTYEYKPRCSLSYFLRAEPNTRVTMDKLFSAGKEFLESQSQNQSQNQNQGQGPSRCSRTPPRRAHGELTEASYILVQDNRTCPAATVRSFTLYTL